MRKLFIAAAVLGALVGGFTVARAIVVAPSGGAAPACANSGCTATTIAGNDSAHIITLSAAAIAPMTVNFSGSWATAPMCVGQARTQTGTTLETVKIDTETNEYFVSYFPLTPGAGDTISVLCFGR